MSKISNATTRLLEALAAATPEPVDAAATSAVPDVARSEERRAAVGEIEIAYQCFGDPGDPPLLLVMGLAAQMVLWDEEFCARLASRGMYVIRFDNRDIGRSTLLQDARAPHLATILARRLLRLPVRVPYTIGDMADDAFGLLDALEIRSTHVVGISMGGMIGQMMAIRSPERVRSLTCLMSSPGARDLLRPRPAAAMALLTPASLDRAAAMARTIPLWRILSGRKMAIDREATLHRAGLAFDRGVNPDGLRRQLAAIYATPPRAAQLRQLRVPTLVIHGDSDPLIPPAAARRLARSVPGSRLEWIEGMGHAMPRSVWGRIIGLIAEHAAGSDAEPG